jgi:hypothetical protein
MKDGVIDNRYISVCVEHLNYTPIAFEELKANHKEKKNEK